MTQNGMAMMSLSCRQGKVLLAIHLRPPRGPLATLSLSSTWWLSNGLFLLTTHWMPQYGPWLAWPFGAAADLESWHASQKPPTIIGSSQIGAFRPLLFFTQTLIFL